MTGEDLVDRVEHVCHRQEFGAFGGIHGAVVMFEQCLDVGVQRETLDSFQMRDLLGGGARLQNRRLHGEVHRGLGRGRGVR
ncbi:hypothetical protein [Nocardia sp. NPDC005998]|uniref:hypothetical protein n=1 Tax=Nocardia sp. NPDC005998 TaxID=3156894 RepID=UPI0033AF86F7